MSDQNVDAVRITRERLHKLEGAEEALRHVAAERDRVRDAIERVRELCAREVARNDELGLRLRPALYVDEILRALDAAPR